MNVKIKLLREGAQLPVRKTNGAAGYDLYTPEDVVIQPGRNVVKIGFAMQMEQGYYAKIKARSGFSSKGFCNEDGTGHYDADILTGNIDPDYRGEIGVIVKSCEQIPFVVKKGTRIAQMIFQRYETPELEEVDELDATDRADGGFGHTGIGESEVAL